MIGKCKFYFNNLIITIISQGEAWNSLIFSSLKMREMNTMSSFTGKPLVNGNYIKAILNS